MKASLLAAGVALGLTGCGPPREPASRELALMGGAPDTNDPGVVALLGGGLCTGTVVAPWFVVTAAHCLAGPPPSVVAFGTDVEEPDDLRTIEESIAHPSFDPDSLEHDIAVLRLGAPADASAWPLSDRRFDDSWLDTQVRLVGFGTTGPPDDLVGTKREGASRITGYRDTTFLVASDPAQACFGDSGGPVFADVEGVETLIGVISRGDAACEERAQLTRVDAHLDFLAEVLELETGAPDDEPSLDLGVECTDHGECESGLCARAEGGDGSSCSVRCFPGSTPLCPDEFECLTNADRPTRSACFRRVPRSSGCAQAGARRSPAMLVVVLTFAVALLRLRPGATLRRRNPSRCTRSSTRPPTCS